MYKYPIMESEARVPDYEFEVDNKKDMVDQYLAFHRYCLSKYGQNILVLYQCGDFYEEYSDGTEGADLKRLSQILDYEISKKQLVGFHKSVLDPCTQILLKHYSPIIRVDEIGWDSQGKRKIRRIVRVITKETYTDSSSYASQKAQDKLLNSGITSQSANLDLITQVFVRVAKNGVITGAVASISVEDGSSNVMQIRGTTEVFFNELINYFSRYRPNFVIISVRSFNKSLSVSEEDVIRIQQQVRATLPENLDSNKVIERSDYAAEYFKIDYQSEFLTKKYGHDDTSSLSIIEQLALDGKPEAVSAFILVLQYVYEKFPRLIEQIPKPLVIDSDRFVAISVDAVNQLSLYNDVNREKTVFDVLNYTKTPMGSRLLLNRLLYPIVNKEELERRYSIIDYFLEKIEEADGGHSQYRWEYLEELLSEFVDLDRYHRRFALGNISPAKVVTLLENYDKVLPIFRQCRRMNGVRIFPKGFKTKFKEFIQAISIIKRDAGPLRGEFIEYNIFIEGYDEDLDHLDKQIKNCKLTEEMITTALEERISSRKRDGQKMTSPLIDVKIDEKNRIYHLETTGTRFSKLKSSLQEEELVISGSDNLVYNFDGNLQSRGKTKKKGFSTDQFDELGTTYFDSVDKLTERLKQLYGEFLSRIAEDYTEFMRILSYTIAEVDFFVALAKAATKHNYCRPQLVDGEFSYLEVTKLRHPIIEQEISHIYVPHDVTLGKVKEQRENLASGNLILLYGSNMCGKSTLLRAVGVSVVMAQMGSFVPAETFTLRLIHSLFTRILTKDNIHRSRSSFQTEMLETKPILTSANEFSLVLADEPCHSTNHTDQVDLVSAFVVELIKRKPMCLVTTHVYELADDDELPYMNGLGIYNLEVNKKGTKLIYTRRIQPGVGERNTAFEVARMAGIPEDVLITSLEFRRKRLKENLEYLSFKRSNYSSSLYMDIMCEICRRRPATETHHIYPQQDADERGFVGHVPIHSKGNLQRLCEDCHARITFGSRSENPKKK